MAGDQGNEAQDCPGEMRESSDWVGEKLGERRGKGRGEELLQDEGDTRPENRAASDEFPRIEWIQDVQNESPMAKSCPSPLKLGLARNQHYKIILAVKSGAPSPPPTRERIHRRRVVSTVAAISLPRRSLVPRLGYWEGMRRRPGSRYGTGPTSETWLRGLGYQCH